MEHEDRRAANVERVAVATLVEICGRDHEVPAFEARSVEVSGRGMHVRTTYLPELHAPLVCRFESDGREVIVEGEVAWRVEAGEDSAFGIRFTALDSNSVEVLKEMCGVSRPMDESVPPPPVSEAVELIAQVGADVKLHIEGLGAPMKARVREGSEHRVQVGANLEFLRVGRSLELENVDDGRRRDAEIDSVSVAVDPQTQIPQLVVCLRYDGAEVTPQPSVIDAAVKARDSYAQRLEPEHSPIPPGASLDPEPLAADEYYDDKEEIESGGHVRERLDILAGNAASMAKVAGAGLAKLGSAAWSGGGALANSAGTTVSKLRAKREETKVPPRRTTAPPPSGVLSTSAQRFRSARQPVRSAAPEPSAPARIASRARVGMIAAAITVLAVGSYTLVGGETEVGESPLASAAAVETETQPTVAATAPAEAVEVEVEPEAPESGDIVANVPLFGPTPMATAQAAELGAQPVERTSVDDVSEDRAFDDTPRAITKLRPEEVQPWGRGRMHLPIVHRMKLSAPGAALVGKRTSRGFSVTVPGREVSGAPSTIERRDDRIVKVRTENNAKGATISFQFRSAIPSYKIRLRKSYIEFFISSPEK